MPLWVPSTGRRAAGRESQPSAGVHLAMRHHRREGNLTMATNTTVTRRSLVGACLAGTAGLLASAPTARAAALNHRQEPAHHHPKPMVTTQTQTDAYNYI